ncbi:Hemicentin-1 [Exaiptasia diaphana]|nr:Hemicentin-1 [Exaiptasia diaphana]
MQCNIFGFPAPRIEWKRALQAMSKERHIITGNRLVIKNTRKDDKGPYMCKGINDHGNVFSMVVLTVHPVIAPAIVKSSPKNVTVYKILSRIKLNCSANGSPLPTIEWSKDGRLLSINTTVHKTNKETIGELVIDPFMPEDQGQYKCFFRNYENGTAETTIQVCRSLCPEIVPPENGYMVGDFLANSTLTFHCNPAYSLRGNRNLLCDANTGNWKDLHGNFNIVKPQYYTNSYRTSVNSFLFSFVNRDNLKPFKMKVFKSQYAIYGSSSYGPIFGGGHDIHLLYNGGSSRGSHTNLGHSYTLIKGYTYGSTKANNLLAGSNTFQVDEVEVFRQEGFRDF